MADARKWEPGFNGPQGFIPYPGFQTCGVPFDEWAQKQEQDAREARIGARDMAGAYVAMQHQDGPSGAMLGQALGGGIAQMARAPGKMFSRSDILAILRAARVDFTQDSQRTVLAFLLHTFENLE